MTSVHRQTFNLMVMAIALASAYLVLLDVGSWVRTVVVVVSLLLLPGSALITHLHLDDARLFLALTVLTSVAILTVTGSVMLWADWWHPGILAAVLGVLGSAALLTDVVAVARSAEAIGVTPDPSNWDGLSGDHP